MKYERPLVLITLTATSTICGLGKANVTIIEATHIPGTVPAYEADE